MKTFLKKIKIIDNFTIELPVTKSEFLPLLCGNVDAENLNSFPNLFEAFSSSANHYKGEVDENGFTLQKRMKLGQTAYGFPRAVGVFIEKQDTLQINVEINAFKKFFLFFFPFAILLYSVFLAIGLSILFVKQDLSGLFLILFILLHATLMLGGIYWGMKKSIVDMHYNLERDFYFMLKK